MTAAHLNGPQGCPPGPEHDRCRSTGTADKPMAERAALDGYDSPDETHRRLVRTLEYVTGCLEDEDADRQEVLEDVERRLTNIIRDMPANRTRQATSKGDPQ